MPDHNSTKPSHLHTLHLLHVCGIFQPSAPPQRWYSDRQSAFIFFIEPSILLSGPTEHIVQIFDRAASRSSPVHIMAWLAFEDLCRRIKHRVPTSSLMRSWTFGFNRICSTRMHSVRPAVHISTSSRLSRPLLLGPDLLFQTVVAVLPRLSSSPSRQYIANSRMGHDLRRLPIRIVSNISSSFFIF
jgi:hypothetical protein